MAASAGKRGPIGLPHGAGEAQEVEAMRAQECRDLGDRKLLLLHMEEEVTALAGGEDVGISSRHCVAPSPRRSAKLLPTTADGIGALAEAALGMKARAARMSDACKRAIEADMHEPPGRSTVSSARQPSVKSRNVMEHAADLDQVELCAKRAKLQDVGLSIDPHW
jgi:hypothetical protein